MKKFKTNLFGVDIDSSSQSALRAETLGQMAINNMCSQNRIKLHVIDLDDNHIKLTLDRTLSDSSITMTTDPGEMLQIDMAVLFPQFQCCPDFGGTINVVRDTQDLLENDIKHMQKCIKGCKISKFEVATYPDRVEVLLSK